MAESVDRRIAKRHVDAPKEVFDELLTVEEWRERLEQTPVGLTIAGEWWYRCPGDEWGSLLQWRRRDTAELATYAREATGLP